MPRILDWIPRVQIEGGPEEDDAGIEASAERLAIEEPHVPAPA
jgi:hypothetical protein